MWSGIEASSSTDNVVIFSAQLALIKHVPNSVYSLFLIFLQTVDLASVSTIDELDREEDISLLSVKQLKTILQRNCIDYKGCVEKDELLTKVKTLWRAREEQRSESTRALVNVL